MTTATTIEVGTLGQDARIQMSELPPTSFEGPANASVGLPGPLTSVQDEAHPSEVLPKGRSMIVITQLAGVNFITSFTNGLLTVGLPAIAADLQLKHSLLLWPSSAFALTSGSCLLLAGSFADVIGSRSVNLAGCFFVAVFTLACGFPRTGIELIMFRAFLGIASALTFPSSISIISKSIASGTRRNVGFATLGLSMPLGFSFGLVLGGVLISGLGWRVGFYIGGAVGFLLFAVGIWSLPVGIKSDSESSTWRRLATEIDWVGAWIASTCLAVFSYFLA